MEKDDGGPAFGAIGVGPAGDVYQEQGMSLRDYFAGQALSLLLAFPEPDPTSANTDLEVGPGMDAIAKHYASVSYRYADAMLLARTQSKDKE